MKKSIFILLFALLGVLSARAYDFKVGSIYYNHISGTSVEVTSPSDSDDKYSGSVVIPVTVTYGGTTYTVTSIGKDAFSFCGGLTSVTIPNGVNTIGEGAFWNCSGLTSVIIPNSVTSIGVGAFWGCSDLKSVAIPNSVTFVGRSAFSGCSGLTSVTIPNSVTSIEDGTFYSCSSLTSVTIPNSVTSIGEDAFLFCGGLTSVIIPEGVTTIKYRAFSGCSGLTSVTIPNSVTSIEESAFWGCSGLTSVTISNSKTSIEEDAFFGCSALIWTAIPASLTKDFPETELWEYFYPFSSYHLYFRSPDNANAAMTMVTEYVAGVDILNEVNTIGPRMKTKESFLAYINSGGEMKTIMKTATPFYIDKERRAILGVQQNPRNSTRRIVLFIYPSGSGLTKWMETVEGEIYTCTAGFTDISFWKDGEKLQRKAVKISKSTRLDNGTEVKEWSYWVKGLSKLATYGYWGDPSQTSCIERSLKIDNKPIIEVSKK